MNVSPITIPVNEHGPLLNNSVVLRVVRGMFATHWGLELRLRDLRFNHKEHMLMVCGLPIFCTDRYLHFPAAKGNPFGGVYEFLRQTEDVIRTMTRQPNSHTVRVLLSLAQRRGRIGHNAWHQKVNLLRGIPSRQRKVRFRS